VAAADATADAAEVVNEPVPQASRLAQVADDSGSGSWERDLTVGDTKLEVGRVLEHALHDSTCRLDNVEMRLGRLRG
jgi:hypothetical protein